MNSNNHIENNNQIEEQKEDGIKKLRSFCNLTLSVSSVFAVIQSLSNFEAGQLAISGFFIGLVVSSSILKSYLEYCNYFSKKITCFFTIYLFLTLIIAILLIQSPVNQMMKVPLNGSGINAINSALECFLLDNKKLYLLFFGFLILSTFFFGIAATIIYKSNFY